VRIIRVAMRLGLLALLGLLSALACASRRPTRVPAAATWSLRCSDVVGPGERGRALPLAVRPGCVAHLDLEPSPRDRGLSIVVEIEGRDAELRLLRARSDGLELPTPAFERIAAGRRLSFSTGVQWSGDADRIRLLVGNTSEDDLVVDAVRVRRDHAVPAHPVGAILAAEHYSEVAVASGDRDASVWLPLPALHGGQVPLDVQTELDPPDSGRIELVRHDAINWGLLAHFPASKQHARVAIAWRATVLVRDVLPDERPRIYPQLEGDAAWLEATTTADASDPRASALARALAADAGDDPAMRLRAMLGWISALPAPSELPSARPGDDGGNRSSALLVSPTRMNCTGTTNVASTLGRALGIPSRHVAGILADEALMTHAVNEFLVGGSWVRIEPQNGETVAQDYMVVLRVVPIGDEGADSVDPDRWGAPGVPMYSLVEAVGERSRLVLAEQTEHFKGCPRCDNAARHVATIHDDSIHRIERLHDHAREVWVRDRDAAIVSGDGSVTSSARARASSIASVDDLERLIEKIAADSARR
jgi:hypothetical protein